MSHTPIAAARPAVSELVRGPLGNTFSITFAPGQSLPEHQNAARLLLTVAAGSGTLVVAGEAPVPLVQGQCVQLDPGIPHALRAGDDGMVLEVLLATACCPSC